MERATESGMRVSYMEPSISTGRRQYADGGGARRRTRTTQPAHRPVVLMVEDDADDRVIYGTVLSRSGFDVVFAEDYESGLRAARERRPDVMLLDVGLPGSKTGLDLCMDVRRGHDTSDLPVVVLSGFAAAQIGEAARAAGCSRYIEKPTSPLAVARELVRLLAG